MNTKNNSGFVKWLLITISALFLAVMLILPLVYVVTTALREGFAVFARAITDKYALKSVMLTLEATVVSVLVNTIFGLFASWLITKFRFRGKKVISALIDLPLTISPIIAGLVFVLTYGRNSILYPFLQKAGINIIFAPLGVILATVFVTFPFVSREIIPVLNSQGTEEEEAASLMGAGGLRIVLCASRAMGEFGAVSVLSGHLRGKTNTMPLYIELLYQGYDFTSAFAMSSLLVVMAVIILILRNVLEYKGKKEL